MEPLSTGSSLAERPLILPFRSFFTTIRKLKQRRQRRRRRRRRRRQRERQKSTHRFTLAKQQLCTCITLLSTVLCRCCTLVKVPNFTFCRGREQNTATLFLFLNFDTVFLEFNSRKICQHLTNWTSWKKHDNVWSSTSRSSSNGQIPFTVNNSGVFSNPALYFGRIPDLEDTLPHPAVFNKTDKRRSGDWDWNNACFPGKAKPPSSDFLTKVINQKHLQEYLRFLLKNF